MRACIDCLPCLARNAIDLAKKTAVDPEKQLEIAKASIVELATSDLTLPPPCYARRMIDRTLEMSGGVTPDPYKLEKDKSTRLALDLLERLDAIPGWNPDDFESRLRLAVSGNVLDFQIYADLKLEEALKVMEEAFVKPVDKAAVAELKRRMDAAKKILWVFDNSGEIVFDRIFLEPYRGKVTLAVRGKPAFNDVTRVELAESGYGEDFAGGGVIDNESGIPGVILPEAGEAMRKAFSESDLIICKGQGNFETMNELKGYPLVFLFLAKCPVVIRAIGAKPRSIQIRIMSCDRLLW